MAAITATWAENQNLHTSGSVTAAATATDDIDLDAAGYDAVCVTIEIVFGGSPDGNVTVAVNASNDSGTNDDTISLHSFAIPEDTSATKRISLVVKDVAYLAIAVTNNDSTDAVTYDSWYAGRTWASA